MIKTKHFLFGLVLGTASIVPLAAPQPVLAQSAAAKAQGRQGIVAAYNKQEKALLVKDITTYMTTISPDFMSYSPNGQTLNYAQSEAMLRNTVNKPILGVPVRITKAGTKIKSISWRGSEAIVMAESTMVAVASKDGRSSRSEVVGISRDFWTPTKTGWKMRQSVQRTMSMWVNGKKVM